MKQFDRQVVLDAAVQVFWRKGYEATSIQDLEQATGLGRGSLYNAFGGKIALFLEVLDRYRRTESETLLRHLQNPDVFVGLHFMLTSIVERMHQPDRPPGCLMTNSCLELGDANISVVIRNGLEAMRGEFESAFLRARQAGQIQSHTDVRALADFFCAIVKGLGVLHKSLNDRRVLESVVKVALASWPR
ncbi:TetR/AcrR family transcriptional regulator [Rhizobium sp. PL01]|uniref:TetR/AcrR family transcriptional regulator n=1 Tax=Rhizobium sp. PL01 TaxID=3085631 RepID=UPI002981E54B|nr:TetR/AcrR family transcriptional regulator [Rhizobium sp. PL01]MDW5318516.1 TetR/AcrR family transcriptional regulator [Rhizobium sp. PL01]